jgi:hypothetical protein
MSTNLTQKKLICPHCQAKIRCKSFPAGDFQAKCPSCQAQFSRSDIDSDTYDVTPPLPPDSDEFDSEPKDAVLLRRHYSPPANALPPPSPFSPRKRSRREPWYYRFVSNVAIWSTYLLAAELIVVILLTLILGIVQWGGHGDRPLVVRDDWNPAGNESLLKVLFSQVIPVSMALLFGQLWFSSIALIFVDIGRQLRIKNQVP